MKLTAEQIKSNCELYRSKVNELFPTRKINLIKCMMSLKTEWR